MAYDNSLQELKKIKIDSLYGKKKHFNAAERKTKYNYLFSIPSIIINFFVGSLLFKMLFSKTGNVLWPAILSFLSALIIGLQTYFNFLKQAEGHNSVGSRYLEVVKECSRIAAYLKDKAISETDFINKLENISMKVKDLNTEAGAFPTSNKDYIKAKESIESGEESYTEKELLL